MASVTASLTDFPVFLDMSTFPTYFWTGLAWTDGRDIRVTNASGTVIPFDVVSVNYGLKKGSIFVKTSLSTSVDTILYVTYGNPRVAKLANNNANGRNAVWSDYNRVFCFSDYGFADRTGNTGVPTINGGVASLSITATSPQLNSHQGICFDGTFYYTTDTNAIYKWDASWNLIATNSNPVGDIGNGVNHIGDLDVVNGILYVPAENYTNITTWSNQRLAKFNASTLAFISSTSVSAQAAEVSGVCYNSEDGYLYVTSYADGSKFWKYDLNFSFVTTLSLSSTIGLIQGMTFWEGAYYVNSDPVTAQKYTYRVEQDGTNSGIVFGPNVNTAGTWEGITHTASSLLAIYSATGVAGDGVAKTLVPYDVAAYSGAAFPASLSSNIQSTVTVHTVWTMGATVSLNDKSINRSITSYGLANDATSNNRVVLAYRQSSDRLGMWETTDTWLLATAAPTVGVKYRVHGTQNGTTKRELFVAGVSQASQSGNAAFPLAGANGFWVGLNTQNTEQMDGDVGFAYLRLSVLSSQWLLAEQANLSSPGTFYTVGTPRNTSTPVVSIIT